MAGLFENWLNFLHELAGKRGQDLATLCTSCCGFHKCTYDLYMLEGGEGGRRCESSRSQRRRLDWTALTSLQSSFLCESRPL